MKVMLAGRWAKAHAMAKALASNPDVELVAAMDRVNPGIRSVADSSLEVDLTDAEAVADAAEMVSAEFVRETERLARGADCTAVQATVDVRNVPSRSLFTSLGYRNASYGDTVEIDGERVMPDYYGSGTDQILFQKDI